MKATLTGILFFIFINAISQQPEVKELSGLPYRLTNSKNDDIKSLVFFISGDGGYASFDQNICTEFAKQGYPVIGLDAFKYFWEEKDAKEVIADVQKLLTYYKNFWNKSEFIFVGYSFGADAMPVIVNRLAPEFRSHTTIIGLLSPSASADLEIHVGDMLSVRSRAGQYDTAQELNRLSFARIVCIYGEDEKNEIRNKISNPMVEFLAVPGGHRYGSNFKLLVELVLKKK